MTDEWNPTTDGTPGEADDGREPVVVFRCSGDTEADVVKSLLESCGIPASKDSDISHIAYPLKYDGLGEVRLRVPAALAEDARKVIADAQAEAGAAGGFEAGVGDEDEGGPGARSKDGPAEPGPGGA